MPYVIVALLVLLADQLSKYLTTIHIPLDTGSVVLIPGVLSLRNIHNYGAAFGILNNARWFFLAVTVLLFIAAAYAFTKRIIHSKPTRWLTVLVLAGALGNAIDRLIHGYVVDMFQFDFLKNFAVFNVADIFITCGTILFCILIFFEKEPREQFQKQKRTHSPALAGIEHETVSETTSKAEHCESTVETISLDSVEDEVAAVFHAISEEKPGNSSEMEPADPAEMIETVATAVESDSAEPPIELEPEVSTVDDATIPTDAPILTAEETTEESPLPSLDSPDVDAVETTESEKTPAPQSDANADLLEEEEEEVFTLADILAEFSDN